MELLYVWIEDYKNIHHQGFNFSPKYRFEFIPQFEDETKKEKVIGGELFQLDGKGNRISKENSVSIQENPIYENFFEPSQKVQNAWTSTKDEFGNDLGLGKITNITAIIGKNGAGKSNLLEFIKEEIRKKISKIPRTGKVHPFLYVMRENDSNIFCSSEQLEIKINDLNKTKVRVEKEFPEYKKLDQTFVFYTNQLNTFREEKSVGSSGMGDFISISLSNTLLKSKGDLETFNTLTIKEHLKFIRVNKEKELNIILPFELPENLEITIGLNYRPINKDNPQWNIFDKLKWDYIRLTLNPSAEYTKFELIVKFLWIKRMHKIIDLIQSKFEITDDTKPFDSQEYVNILEFEEAMKAFLKLNAHQKYENARILLSDKQLFQSSYLNFFEIYFKDELQEIIIYPQYNLQDEPTEIMKISFISKLDYNNKDDINKYLILIENSEYNFFHLNWIGLSSGEEALLSIYSRFYNSLFNSEGGESLFSERRTLFLLIDEGEVGFHPEWQRTYLLNLIDYLPQIYSPAQIQIIFTTHSPFLASDLPKENIIFLKKGEEIDGTFIDGVSKKNKCLVVDGLKSKEKTFAGNIHTLLSDGFFLEGGLIGEFASGKIKEIQTFYKEVKEIEKALIEEKILDKSKDERSIQKKKEYESKKDAFWKIQGMIGEEYLAVIVKNHLDEIETILLEKDTAKEEKISRLRKELEALENEKGTKPK